MSTLYEISEELLALFSELEDSDGEPTEEQLERLNISEKELKYKSVAYYSVIKENESFINVLDDEIKRLQAKKKKANKLIESLSNRLLGAVSLFGNFEAGTHSFKTRKSTIVDIEDESVIPEDYFKIKTTQSVDKKKLAVDLKAGGVIQGVRLKTNLNLKID